MSGNMKLAIELAVTGAQQVGATLKAIGDQLRGIGGGLQAGHPLAGLEASIEQAAEGIKADAAAIGQALGDGITTGIEGAVKAVEVPLDRLEATVDASAAEIRLDVDSIGGAFRQGLVEGMSNAVRSMNRPIEELKRLAKDARDALSIRPDIEIEEDIRRARQAYDDLKSSGLATSGELTRAKSAMLAKIGELRVELGKWSGDWKALGQQINDIGGKMQGIGAKLSIAGAPAILAGKSAIEAEHSLVGIANTAGVDPAKAAAVAAAWKRQINDIAHVTNQAQDDLVQAMGVMVSKGLDPDKAIAMLRPVGDAATATGSQIGDIAKTLYSTYDNLKTPIAEAGKTLDVLATAGNRGAFELKDMSQYFPTLSAAAGQLEMHGVAATASIAAAAQVAMKGAGDASQAANNLNNFLLKLTAPDTMNRFDEFGVDLSAEIKKGLASGDLVGYMAELINKMTGGNAEKISQLFGDQQVKMFLAPMLANIEEYRSIRDEALKAVGTIDAQKEAILSTTQEKIKGIGINFSKAIDEATLFQAVLDKVKSAAEWFAGHPDVFGPIATVVSALAVGGAGIAIAGTALTAIGTGLSVIAAAWTSGMLAAALPAIMAFLGVVAAWKVGDAFGSWIAGEINKLAEAASGIKGATLGTVLYDVVDQWEGASKEFPRILGFMATSIVNALGGDYATFTDMIDRWKQAGGNLIQGLRDGIAEKLHGALGIGEKLADAVTYIKGTVQQWRRVGGDLIDGLWEGIKAEMRKPLDAIGELAQKLPKWAKDLLGIHSPSRVFAEIGENIGDGLAQGIRESTQAAVEAAAGLAKEAVAAAAGKGKNAKQRVRLAIEYVEEQGDRRLHDLKLHGLSLDAAARSGGIDAEAAQQGRYDLALQTYEVQREVLEAIKRLAGQDAVRRAALAGRIADLERRTELDLTRLAGERVDRRGLRDQAIVERFEAGATVQALAQEYKLSEGWIRQILKARSEAFAAEHGEAVKAHDKIFALEGKFTPPDLASVGRERREALWRDYQPAMLADQEADNFGRASDIIAQAGRVAQVAAIEEAYKAFQERLRTVSDILHNQVAVGAKSAATAETELRQQTTDLAGEFSAHLGPQVNALLPDMAQYPELLERVQAAMGGVAKAAADVQPKTWMDGLLAGLDDYAESSAEVFKATRDAVGRAFKGMEDALVQFVRTGKIDFKSLADSIIADMIRMQIQQNVMGPLKEAAGALFASFFAAGGVVQAHADGGYITGPGGPRDDKIPAMLSNGEYVINAAAVSRVGVGLLDSINRGLSVPRFASGGVVGAGAVSQASAGAAQPSAVAGNQVAVTQHITVDARGADAGVDQKILLAMRRAKDEAVNAINSSLARGGATARLAGVL